MKTRNYPEILKTKINDSIRFETSIRIKRDGVWYDIVIVESGTGNKDVLIDQLILTKLYWEVPDKEMMERLGIKPSENQNDTVDDLLDDEQRVNRLKETAKMMLNR